MLNFYVYIEQFLRSIVYFTHGTPESIFENAPPPPPELNGAPLLTAVITSEFQVLHVTDISEQG